MNFHPILLKAQAQRDSRGRHVDMSTRRSSILWSFREFEAFPAFSRRKGTFPFLRAYQKVRTSVSPVPAGFITRQF